MTINRRPLNKRKFNTTFTQKFNAQTHKILNNKDGKSTFVRFFVYGISAFLICIILGGVFIYVKYIVGLPDVTQLENLEIAESSIIYDRNGKELYKIFKEKRTYVTFENINKNMINALVSIEDKRYWTNPGVDILGLFRAGLNFALGKSDDVKGTSTLTQQLIRNTIIKNEKSIERKVKEVYLAYKLTSSVSKEKILELYLNKISYGNNAYGIEEAAKTYFDKSSKDLSILESSILASLPKGPTYYSPYSHPDRLIGYPYIYNNDKEDEPIKIISQKDKDANIDKVKILTDFISKLKSSRLEGTEKTLVCNIDKKYFKTNLNIDGDGCTVIPYSELITLLNNIRIKIDDNNYIEYETGRKDRVLGRMLEDKYITFDEYKNSIVNAIGYTFSQKKEDIKAPHFVFYVKEYLEEKYGKEIVSVGGLKIYTTLDLDLQQKAEELIAKQIESNSKKFDASNAALISIDNKSGGILSMVGGKNYFDNENKGNVNIITSKLQPGSTFKPFVYSIAMFNKAIGTKTPIYDLETKFPGGYNPSNYDGKFMGKMNVSTALNNSRNIPALKMFFLAGGEQSIISFMKKIGVNSLKTNGTYGASLALGTGEMTPLELATAYSTFANMGVKREITPILKIVDSKGNIIEENKKKTKEEKIISEEQSYLINSILSDTSSRPSGWNKYISIKNRLVAAKTGTSTKQYEIKGVKQKFPSNLWTAGYTPQITTVVWAGNTDGGQMNTKGDGLNGAGPIWRDYMEYAHKGLPVEKWKKPAGVKEIYISEISGLLPDPERTDKSMLVSSLFVNPPKTYDNSYKQLEVDSLCNGKITENTPEAAKKTVTVLELNDIDPTNANWQAPVRAWARTDAFKAKYGIFTDLVTDVSDKECERNGTNSDISIKTNIKDNDTLSAGENYVELNYSSKNPIIKIETLIDDMVVDEVKIDNKNEGTYAGNIFIPVSKAGKQSNLVFRAVDNQYFSNIVTKNVMILKKDISVPEVKLINPIDGSITLYNTDYFNLKATVKDNSSISSINILMDGAVVKSGITDRNIVFPVNSERDMTIGNHVVTIEVIDNNGNKTTKDVKVEVLQN